jgi:two-component system response regulator AtoC
MVVSDELLLLPEHFTTLLGKGDCHNQEDSTFDGFSLKDAREVVEKKLIIRALEETASNRTHAARLLGISHPSLLTKIKAYGIDL